MNEIESTRIGDATETATGSPNGAEAPPWEETDVPCTELGRRLLEIRKLIVASGQPLLSLEEFEREMAERRGCSCPDDEP